ncbi:cutinase family protein [Nocardia noduli]|uniref:cutinase family protein n=1 Tax=Nocardia noduli TaxID=2815722 RepID=UPI001C23782B|nr:cutinase family protein [Nocardia noduli]
MHSTRTHSRRLIRSAVIAAIIGTATVNVTVTASAEPGVQIEGACPALYVLGVQGGEEGDVATGSDTGALGQVFGPLSAAAGKSVQRAYIPYGQSADGSAMPYDDAVTAAAEHLEQAAARVQTRCPATRLAVAGYAHGAAAADRFAARVGAGASTVSADRVAAVALLANPARALGAPTLPGRPQTNTPSAAPGTAGTHVSTITLLNPRLTGAGITATATAPSDYGTLTGRVADLCVGGDATCDTAPGSPLASTVANIAARSDLRDPIAAISTIATALSTTVFTTAVGVVNEDLSGTSLDQLSYQPAKPLGQRLAEASAPTATAPSQTDALSALFKLGTIGLNAAISVARTVLTPATVAELATVGMADPLAAVGVLGAKLAAAVVQLVPPQTASRWVNDAFEAITSTVTAPDQLYTLAGSAQYSDTTGRHGSYTDVPATGTGESTLRTVSAWFTALARDLADTTPTTASTVASTTRTPSATAPSPSSSPSASTSSVAPSR